MVIGSPAARSRSNGTSRAVSSDRTSRSARSVVCQVGGEDRLIECVQFYWGECAVRRSRTASRRRW